MKKIWFLLLISVFIFSLLGMETQNVLAQGPAGSWSSVTHCINQSSTNDAVVTLKYYRTDNSTPLEFNDVIPAGKSKTFIPDNSLGSFSGSLVINSSGPISCSAQQTNNATGTKANPFRMGAAAGFSNADITDIIFVSQLLKNFSSGAFGFYQSYMAIQNTSSSATDILIEYTDRGVGLIPTANQNLTIPANSSIILHQHQNPNLPNGFLGSAKITSDGAPLAVTAVFYNDGSSYTKAQVNMYNGTASGESRLYAPYVMRNFYDFNSGMNIINVGDSPTSFRIIFNIGRGGTVREYIYQHPTNIQPGGLASFFLPNMPVLNPVDGLSMSERAGYAIIEATDTNGEFNITGELIANINYRNDGRDPNNPNFGGHSVTFNAIGSTFAGKTLFVPNIQNQVGGALFTGGIAIANTESQSATCSIIFNEQSPSLTHPVTVPADGIYAVLVSNIPGLQLGYNGGAIINCNRDVVVVSTLRAESGNYWGDSQSALNVPKAE